MRVQSTYGYSSTARSYQAGKIKKSPVTNAVSNSKGKVSFGQYVKVDEDAAKRFFTELFGVEVEKTADDMWDINFATAGSFPYINAKKMCDDAVAKVTKMGEELRTKYSTKDSSPWDFARELYRYLQMGGGQKPTLRCHPGVMLNGAAPEKVTTPIIIKHIKGISGDEGVGEISNLYYPFERKLNDLFQPSSDGRTVSLTTKGEQYILTRRFGSTGDWFYSSEKLNMQTK